MKYFIGLISLVLLVSFLPLNASAQEHEEWDAKLTTYMFLPTTIEIMPIVNGMSPSDPIKTDIFELIDELGLFDGVWAFSSHFEMWKKWGILLNLDWIKIDGGTTLGPVSASLEFETLNVDFALGYEFGKFDLSQSDEYPNARVFGWVGFQYNYLDETLNISLVPNKLPLPGSSVQLGGDQDWVENIVGLGIGVQLNEKLIVEIRAQTGSFGFSETTDENWWIISGFRYRFSERWSADLAYKYWSYDYMSDTVGLDQVMHGIWLGGTFHM